MEIRSREVKDVLANMSAIGVDGMGGFMRLSHTGEWGTAQRTLETIFTQNELGIAALVR